MSWYMNQELRAFAGAFFQGAVLICVYDSLNIWRAVKKRKRLLSDGLDLLFWVFAAVYTFRYFYQVSSGTLRGYLFAGMALGVLAWKYSLERTYMLLGEKLFRILEKILNIPGKALKKLRKRLKFRTGKGKMKTDSSLRTAKGEKAAKAGKRTEKIRKRNVRRGSSKGKRHEK